jgi:capping protein beta
MSDELENQLNSCLNLVRRMPPSTIENTLAGLLELAPEDLEDELFSNIDVPLKLETDTDKKIEFICCDYNRDEDSYRSPWTNKYYPPTSDPHTPNAKLREMECTANSLFMAYKKLYFEGGHSSVYFFETEEETEEKSDNFGACWLIHKDVESERSLKKGWWDSTHVFEVQPSSDGTAIYKLTTTVMISMVISDDKVGVVDLSGMRTMQQPKKMEFKTDVDHVCNMGKQLEAMEQRLRNSIESIYIQKTREVINGVRDPHTSNDRKKQIASIAQSLQATLVPKN